jgi:PHD/YefM family antitoxin component YafN of YafNO toxin-antitoxin module
MIGDATQFVIDSEGRKVAVVLPVEEYEELLEDLHDLAVVAERRDEPRVAWEDVKRELREDGLLHD